jgi:hypothetical protein
MDASQWVEGNDSQVRSDDAGEDDAQARRAAQPVQRVTRAEKKMGGGEKYFQLSAKPANCRKKNIQGSEPTTAGSLPANYPRCHATEAANKK